MILRGMCGSSAEAGWTAGCSTGERCSRTRAGDFRDGQEALIAQVKFFFNFENQSEKEQGTSEVRNLNEYIDIARMPTL